MCLLLLLDQVDEGSPIPPTPDTEILFLNGDVMNFLDSTTMIFLGDPAP